MNIYTTAEICAVSKFKFVFFGNLSLTDEWFLSGIFCYTKFYNSHTVNFVLSFLALWPKVAPIPSLIHFLELSL